MMTALGRAVVRADALRHRPAVIWISESGRKVFEADDVLARRIGLKIDPSRNLPDIILADLGTDDILIVFVEVVATDGPISEDRRRELLALATVAKLDPEHVGFVTAFMDRSDPTLRKTLPMLAGSSFAWVAAEPEKIIVLVGAEGAQPQKLHRLLATGKPQAK